ncbi:hypothetical protein [Pseudomonas sp.]|uniref:hypothetical protein n=1 Tax=Pseudomonas sp. TaxID=306 RepID=UPI0028A6682C|nr:hypothetical protein [Pseudomonas sp.]
MILRTTTLCLALLLAACDSGDKPAGPPNEPTKPKPITQVEPAAPRKEPQPPMATKPVVADRSEAKPVEEAPAPAAPVVKSKGKAQDKAEDTPSEEVSLAKPKLDLSLPRELVESLEPESKQKVKGASESGLLPPMFADKENDQQPFQLSGRVISNEIERNSGIEGAELQFHFRQ